MKSATFLIGAGASVEFGFKATRGFLEDVESKMEFRDNGIGFGKDEIELFNEVKEYLKERTNNEPDIEQILFELQGLIAFFKHFETGNEVTDANSPEKKDEHYSFIHHMFVKSGNFYHRKEGRRYSAFQEYLANIKATIGGLKDKINRMVHNSYSRTDERNKHRCRKTYKSLIDGIIRPVSIFTTNYDCCIETALKDEEKFFDGFCKNSGGVWKPDWFNRNDVRLFKLHGSIDWHEKIAAGGKVYYKPAGVKPGTGSDLIIYPGFKDIPTKKPLIFMHERLKEVLLQSEICVVIGFAFRDQYINSIFKEAMRINRALKIINWNIGHDGSLPFLTGDSAERNRYYKVKGGFPDDIGCVILDSMLNKNEPLRDVDLEKEEELKEKSNA